MRKVDQPVYARLLLFWFQANGSVYFRLSAEQSIQENLKGITIIEFPTIHVLNEIPRDWTVENALCWTWRSLGERKIRRVLN